MENIKYKLLHPDAKPPVRASEQAAGWDLTVVKYEIVKNTYPCTYLYDFGIAFEIPDGWCGLMCARSSSIYRGMMATSGVGVIDSDYRGSVHMAFTNIGTNFNNIYKVGERAAQIIFLPAAASPISLCQAVELSETARNTCGFGSTN